MGTITFDNGRTLEFSLDGEKVTISERGEFRGALRIGAFDDIDFAHTELVKSDELPIIDADLDPDDDLDSES